MDRTSIKQMPVRSATESLSLAYSFGAALITATNLAWAASGVID